MRCVYRSVSLLALVGLALSFNACGGSDGGGNGGNGGNGNGGPPEGTGLVRLGAARTGNYGLRVPITNPLSANRVVLGPQYVQDDTPNGLKRYLAHFWLRLDGASLTDFDTFELFNGYDMVGDAWFKAQLATVGGDARLVLNALENGGGEQQVSYANGTTLGPGYNQISLFFDCTVGLLETHVNGMPGPSLSGLDNGNAQIDFVRLGIVDGIHDAATQGFIDLDDFGQGAEGNLPVLTQEDGLPAGTTFNCTPELPIWTCLYPGCGMPGGTLGSDRIQETMGFMQFSIDGTGSLSGFARSLLLPYTAIVDIGPAVSSGDTRTNAVEVIEFDFGPLAGDPDFDSLQIKIGSGLGLPPSIGSTALTDNLNGTFQLDTFFDVIYEIEFVGAPGGVLDGMSSTGVPTTLDDVPFQFEAEIFADGFESGDTSAWSGSVP